MVHKSKHLPCTVSRLQFPIKIAYCLTINRAQGQSASKCGILLPKDVWTHGQIYVPFLDAEIQTTYKYGRNNYNLKHIICPNKKTYVKNVVYNEVIKDITSE